MTPPESALPFWTLVRQLQHTADNSHLDYRSWVADEQLTELLERSDRADLASEEVAMFNRQTRYRARKLFDRSRMLRAFAERRAESEREARDSTAVSAEDIRRLITIGDWELLFRLANGTDYETLATERGVPVGTLKSSVSRLRREIRQWCYAA